MKTKILLAFAILVCAAITSSAQVNEGRYLLGGNSGFYKNQPSGESTSEVFNTNIQFGKVIKDNTVAGIFLSFGYSNGVQYKMNQFGAGVFYRKYKPLAKDLYFFGEGDALYNYSKTTQNDFQIGSSGTRNSFNGGSLSFIPGISYSICKRMQMELAMPNLVSLSYGVSKNETTNTGTSAVSSQKINNFSAGVTLNSNLLYSFGIGFKFLLGK